MLPHASTVLIIGGSGYIGQCLAGRLDRDHRVLCTYYLHQEKVLSGEKLYLDVRDSPSVVDLIRSKDPDVIYLFSYSHLNLEETIIHGALNVMAAAEPLSSRVILLSTDAVFGGQNKRYSERDIPDYITAYGRAKYEAEKIVLNRGGFVVRTSLVYGFNPPDPRVSELLQGLKKGETKTAYFTDEFRSPVFIDDLCCMLADIPSLQSPRLLHITGPDCISRRDIASMIARRFNLSQHRIRTSTLNDSGLNRPRFLCLDSRLSQRVLNYRIRSLDEVLRSVDPGNGNRLEKTRKLV